MSKIEFKEFVRKNPNLITYVEKNETTWQKLYELYDLYGDDNEVWDKYKNNPKENTSKDVNPTFKDLINMVKGIDLNTVQKGLNSLDKAIETFKDLANNSKTPNINNYEPRPTYRYFED